MAELNRRNFLRNILGGTAAAVAAASAIKLEYVPEVKAAALEELERLEDRPRDEIMEAIKESMTEPEIDPEGGLIMVAMPKKVFHPDARIWKSVSGEAAAWADYLTKKTGVDRKYVLPACRRLAQACDQDLKIAEVDSGTQIIVDLPHVTRSYTDSMGRPQVEIAMGVEKNEFLGIERVRVGFINNKSEDAPKLVDAKGYDTLSRIESKKREIARLQNEINDLSGANEDWVIERDID